jgi:hypothetical protein
MSVNERTRRVAQKKSKSNVEFVWKHHALTQDFVLLRKQGLTLIINLYCYWTHDNKDKGVSINAWFGAWAKSMEDKGIVKDDGSPYSVEYLRIYTNKVRQIVEGGFRYQDIKSIKDLEEKVLRVNGKSEPKKELSPVEKELARIEKMSAREQRAIFNKLAKKFA